MGKRKQTAELPLKVTKLVCQKLSQTCAQSCNGINFPTEFADHNS